MKRDTREWVDLVVDADALARLVGRAVRATSLRIKPGTSVVIGLAAADGGADGWARLLTPQGRAKAAKAARLASRHRLRLGERDVGDGALLQVGEIAADPRLREPLRRAHDVVGRGPWAGPDVLRHNPMRRVVLRRGDVTVRVLSGGDVTAWHLDRALCAAGVALPGRLDDGSNAQVAVQPFVGDHDLVGCADAEAHRRAGQALAGLHHAEVPGTLRAALAGRMQDVARQGRAHVRLLGVLEPALARRLQPLVAATASLTRPLASAAPTVLVHGDFSPDQVVRRAADGRVWLTDLDRVCTGAAALDVGSYLTWVPDAVRGDAFQQGYRDAGGELVEADVAAAQARAVLLALTSPLRNASPGWRAEVAGRLDLLERAIERAGGLA